MSEIPLPKGWQIFEGRDCVLNEKADIVDGPFGSNLKATEYTDSGVPVVRIQNVKRFKFVNKNIKYVTKEKAELIKRHTFQPKDILITKLGEPVGLACISPESFGGGVIVADIVRFRNCEKYVNRHYLMYLLNSQVVITQISSHIKGTTRQRINLTVIRDLKLPVAPFNEQFRIANKLDELLAQVNTIKARVDAIPTILKRFRQSVLAAAVSGKLTEEWRNSRNEYVSKKAIIDNILISRREKWEEEQIKSFDRKGNHPKNDNWKNRYKDPTVEQLDEYDTTLIGGIPKEWVSSNLDTVSLLVTGKTPSTTDEDNWNGETPFLSPSQILPDGNIKLPKRHVSTVGKSKSPILPKDSILIVCIGTIGKVGFLDKESAFNQQINAMIAVDYMDSRFLFYWAKTLHTWLNKTSSAVVNAAIINKSRLSTAPCPVPSREEQILIVERIEELLDFADQIDRRVNDAQFRINNLTQSILVKTFRGELVPQDSSDEPARELLARIQKEREEAEILIKVGKKSARRKQ
jgi:type I restriction enzyme S subunit